MVTKHTDYTKESAACTIRSVEIHDQVQGFCGAHDRAFRLFFSVHQPSPPTSFALNAFVFSGRVTARAKGKYLMVNGLYTRLTSGTSERDTP